MLLSDYIADVQEIVHDTTASSWPLARVISRINDARLDVARDMWCVRQNVTGVQLLPGVEIYGLNGAIVGATVLTPGSNYGSGATVPVVFAPPITGGGVQALGFGNLVNGSLASITMTQWGQGYTGVEGITIGGTGSGASAAKIQLFKSNIGAATIGNPLAIMPLSYTWNGQRRTMSYLDFTLFQAYPRMWNVIGFQGPPGVFTHHQQGQQLYIQTPPDQVYLAEFDTIFLPAPLVSTTDIDTQIIDPWARAVQWKAASLLLYKHQNFAQAQALEAKYDAIVPRILTTASGIRFPNPYHSTFQRRVSRAMGG
jgi:hypothetical protein